MPQTASVPAIHSFNKHPSPVLCQAWVSFCWIISFNSLRALQGCYYNLLCTGDKTETSREVRNIFKTIELESAGVGIKVPAHCLRDRPVSKEALLQCWRFQNFLLWNNVKLRKSAKNQEFLNTRPQDFPVVNALPNLLSLSLFPYLCIRARTCTQIIFSRNVCGKI